MPAYPRSQIVSADEVGVYHCVARCVRRAFLCGLDVESGHDYEHRKKWIRERLEELAAVFAIDICGYAVMSNHIHLVLRVRPDLAREWSFEYLTLLEWTGRQLRAGKRGTIPDQIAPILERLGVIGEGWVETVRQFGRRFKTAAGRRESRAASLAALAGAKPGCKRQEGGRTGVPLASPTLAAIGAIPGTVIGPTSRRAPKALRQSGRCLGRSEAQTEQDRRRVHVRSGLMHADRPCASGVSPRDNRRHPSQTPERIWRVCDFPVSVSDFPTSDFPERIWWVSDFPNPY